MSVRVFASIGYSVATVLTGAAVGALVGFLGYGFVLGTEGAPGTRAQAHVEEQIASLATPAQCLPELPEDRLLAWNGDLAMDIAIC